MSNNLFKPISFADFPEALPAYSKADSMRDALLVLQSYYGASSGKAAAAAKKRLDPCYWVVQDANGRTNWISPTHLSPWTEKELAKETPEIEAYRRLYWTQTLRPALTEPTFFEQFRKCVVRKKDARYDTEDRDKAIKTLEEGLVYFDAHFGTGGK